MDAKCKQLTASWVRERHVSNPDIEVCDFYETLEAAGAEAVLEPGVYTLQVPLPSLHSRFDVLPLKSLTPHPHLFLVESVAILDTHSTFLPSITS